MLNYGNLQSFSFVARTDLSHNSLLSDASVSNRQATLGPWKDNDRIGNLTFDPDEDYNSGALSVCWRGFA